MKTWKITKLSLFCLSLFSSNPNWWSVRIYFHQFSQGNEKDKTVISKTTSSQSFSSIFLSAPFFIEASSRHFRFSLTPTATVTDSVPAFLWSVSYFVQSSHTSRYTLALACLALPCRDHPLMFLYCRSGRVYLQGCDFRVALQQISFSSHNYTSSPTPNLNKYEFAKKLITQIKFMIVLNRVRYWHQNKTRNQLEETNKEYDKQTLK